MKAAWVGYKHNAHLAENVFRYLDKFGIGLRIISDRDGPNPAYPKIEYVRWDADTWRKHVSECEFGIAPQDVDLRGAKSDNKVMQYWSCGIPVVASDMTSYRHLLEMSAFVAQGGVGKKCLWLVDDRLGLDGWELAICDIVKHFYITCDWDNVKSLCYMLASGNNANCVKYYWKTLFHTSEKIIYVVIPTLSNWDYLKYMLISLLKHDSGYRIKPIVVSDNLPGRDDIDSDCFHSVDFIFCGENKYFSRAVNLGIDRALELDDGRGQSYLMIANDDILFTPHSISTLIQAMDTGEWGIVGPLSNCDKGWQFENQIYGHDKKHEFPIAKPMEEQDYTPDVIMSDVPYIKDEDLLSPRGVEWLTFYCVLTRLDYVRRVGMLSEDMKIQYSDKDYCDRLVSTTGKPCGHIVDSFVFHYGGVTKRKLDEGGVDRKMLEEEDRKAWVESQKQAPTVIRASESRDVPIIFYSGPSWEKWDPNSINTGIGGSELCHIFLARELASRGWKVISYSDCESRGNYDGVEYIPFGQLSRQKSKSIIINVRRPYDAIYKVDKTRVILWNHDVYYPNMDNFNESHKEFDAIVNLSPWHGAFWSQRYPEIPKDKLFIIPDGIEPAFFDGIDTTQKAYGSFIWASSYDRGLDILIRMMDRMRSEGYPVTLNVYYGNKILKQMAIEGRDGKDTFYINMMKLINQRDWITHHGRVGLRDLARARLENHVWCYPTYFTETFCRNSLEEMLSMTPVICSDIAALQNTVGRYAYEMISGSVYEHAVQDQFKEACKRLLQTPWDQLRPSLDEAHDYASQFTWKNIVDKFWEPLLFSLSKGD